MQERKEKTKRRHREHIEKDKIKENFIRESTISSLTTYLKGHISISKLSMHHMQNTPRYRNMAVVVFSKELRITVVHCCLVLILNDAKIPIQR